MKKGSKVYIQGSNKTGTVVSHSKDGQFTSVDVGGDVVQVVTSVLILWEDIGFLLRLLIRFLSKKK